MVSLIWAVIGLLLIVAEFFVPGLVVIFFGAGGLLTALVTLLFPNMPILAQIFVWLGASALSLGLLRKLFSKALVGKKNVLENLGDDDIGKKAEVIEAIGPNREGRVKYQGTTWRALSYDEAFEPGSFVEILKKDNLTLVVTKSLTGAIDDDNIKRIEGR